ncbi:hypothetical protein GCM10008023_40910 [Sphingomonas glacialis]|uniref:Uncharacterized protein n=1 Tax=Sphingomonas glacialis TaxID=658225 RepID=A0ABQ3LUT4_9SPHN|nr:hypothetical protein GCM10008023_40910 [Sphingomonas glacialis]
MVVMTNERSKISSKVAINAVTTDAIKVAMTKAIAIKGMETVAGMASATVIGTRRIAIRTVATASVACPQTTVCIAAATGAIIASAATGPLGLSSGA